MTTHVRQQILEAIQTAVTSLTTTGANVFLSRTTPLARDQVPALLIHAGPEQLRADTLPTPRKYLRRLQVDIVCAVRATDGVDAALNQIFAEVEVALAMPNAIFVGVRGVQTITLDNIDRPKIEQGEQPVAQAALAYAIEYYAAENNPTGT
jgi:hypothetical protein